MLSCCREQNKWLVGPVLFLGRSNNPLKKCAFHAKSSLLLQPKQCSPHASTFSVVTIELIGATRSTGGSEENIISVMEKGKNY